MDREQLRQKVNQDAVMTPEQWVKMSTQTMPGGPLSPDNLEFLVMVEQEIKRDLAPIRSRLGWWKNNCSVARAYNRWMRGDRPE
jgi:hypothetical protein